MSPVVKRKGEKFTIPSKYLLFVLTCLCTILMVVTISTNILNKPINTAENPVTSVATGLSKIIKDDNYKSVAYAIEGMSK